MTFYDLRVVGHYLGILILFSAFLMVIPFCIALIFQEWEPATRYLLSIGIALVSGSLLRFCSTDSTKLNRQQAMVVVGLAWIVLGLFCSIPLFLSGHYLSYLDAVFDGVSGLTTTGASMIVDLDHLSYADNMFRFMMHLLGGLGLIVVALSLGVFGRRTNASLFSSEGRSEHVVPNVVQTARFIALVTAIVIFFGTIAIGGLLTFQGIEPVRAGLQAFWVAISGFVTGGFTPMQQSVLYYHSYVVEILLMILMVMGAISFVIYSEVLRGRISAFFKDIETSTALFWIVAMTLVLAATLAATALFSDLPAMIHRGVFTMMSAFTTTGFSVITQNQLVNVLGPGAILAIALVMAVGGGAGSTAGGIKIFRIGIIFRSIAATIKEKISPDSARVVVSYTHLGRKILSPEVVKEATTVCILYIITYLAGALVGIAHNFDPTHAIFESVAMASNGGITAGIAQPSMPKTLEVMYIVEMWAGRLEFITFLALIVQIAVSLKPRKKGALVNMQSQSKAKQQLKPDAPRDRTQKDAPNTTSKIVTCALACAIGLGGVAAATNSIGYANADEVKVSAPTSTTAAESDAAPSPNEVNPSQLPDSSFIYDASISDLSTATSYMDGQTVQVVGEVVGDRVNSDTAPQYCWVTMQDAKNTTAQIGVFMLRSSSEMVDMYGKYGQVGTTIQARGTFNLACKDHEGVSDLHATSVSLVKKGYSYEIPFNPVYLGIGIALIAIGIALSLLYRYLLERER